jgi:hypothetical protein
MQATYRQFRTRPEYKYESYTLNADMPCELIEKHFALLTVALLDAQIDFEYGDEEILAKDAAAEAGAMRVGKMTYRTVFVQPMVNMRSTTLALLREFVAKGGKIVLAGSAPSFLDGRPSQEPLDFFNAHAKRVIEGVDFFDYEPTTAALGALGCRTVETSTPVPQLKVHRRVWDGKDIIFVANISRDTVATEITFTPAVSGHVEEWDVADGTSRPVVACSADKPVTLPLSWHPKQARTFLTVPGVVDIPVEVSWKEDARIRPEWIGTRTGPNVLLLDECTVQDADGGAHTLSVGKARNLIEAARLEGVDATKPLSARFPIRVAEANPPDATCELAIEFGLRPRITLNATPASLTVLGWVIDPAIQRIALPALKSGENTLVVEAVYEKPTEFESPWLMGEFAVMTQDNVVFTVGKANNIVPIGAWHTLGLPFYTGSVVYRTEVELPENDAVRFVLDLPGLAGSAQVTINGKVAETILWPPYSCDITGFVKSGKNIIEIEVANTLRNLLGAHYVENEEIRTGAPTNMYTAPLGTPKKFWNYGLLTAPEIVISKKR